MKTWTKVLIISLLSFCVAFVSIGYAALTDELAIEGNVSIEVPQGLFITSITPDTQSNIESRSATYLGYTTTVDSTIDKTAGTRVTGTASYTVTVYNNTQRVYAYRGIYYQTSSDTGFDSSYNGNDYISDTSAGNGAIYVSTAFEDGSTVEPDEYLTFTVTYTVGQNLSSDTSWRTLINFQFGINVDSAAEIFDAVTDKFDDILNTTATYEQIIDAIDNKYDGRGWTATYFGNVAGSSDEDSVAINTLFAGQLSILVDGVEQPVTVIIKRENIDGNVNTGDDYTVTNGTSTSSGYGCEYTLYMTTESLTTYNSYPTVYAMVYTCNRDADGNLGEWYMLGERYEGTAQVVGYVGGQSSGSFDTGSWQSKSQTLSPAECYSYSISASQTINSIVTAKDSNANDAMQSLLDDAYTILTENKYAGTGMVALENIYEQMADIYTVNEDGAPTVNDVSRAVLIPYIQKMENGLKMFELSELEALAKLGYSLLKSEDASDQLTALETAYNAAKNAGLFTDEDGVIVTNENATYSDLKDYVDDLSEAVNPFYDE